MIGKWLGERTDLNSADEPVKERTVGITRWLARQKICNLDDAVFVEKFGLKDLDGG